VNKGKNGTIEVSDTTRILSVFEKPVLPILLVVLLGSIVASVGISFADNPLVLFAAVISLGAFVGLLLLPEMVSIQVLLVWSVAISFFYAVILRGEVPLLKIGDSNLDLLGELLPLLIIFSVLIRVKLKNLFARLRSEWKYMIFVALALFSITYSQAPRTGLRAGVQLVFPLCVYLMVTSTVESLSDVKTLIRSILWVGMFNVLATVVALLFVPETVFLWRGDWYRFEGTMGANQTALFQFNLLILVCSLLVTVREVSVRPVLLICGLSFLAYMLLTGTRLTMLMLLIVIAILIWYKRRNIPTLAASLLLAFLLFYILDQISTTWSGGTFELEYNSLNALMTGRPGTWQEFGLDRFEEAGFFGTGLGTTFYWFSQAGTLVRSMHNEYIRMRVEVGWLGILSFITVIIDYLFRCYKNFRFVKNDWSKSISLAALFALIGLTIGAAGSDYLTFMNITMYVWFYLALAHRAIELEELPVSGPRFSSKSTYKH